MAKTTRRRNATQEVGCIMDIRGAFLPAKNSILQKGTSEKRSRLLEEKFTGRTAKILTLNTLSGKLLMKECGKIVAAKNETEMNQVSGFIPKVFGQVADIEDAYEDEEKFKEWVRPEDMLGPK